MEYPKWLKNQVFSKIYYYKVFYKVNKKARNVIKNADTIERRTVFGVPSIIFRFDESKFTYKAQLTNLVKELKNQK